MLNPLIEREQAAAYGVDVTPALVVEGARDYGIRFLGLPARLRVRQPDRLDHRRLERRAAPEHEHRDALGGLTEDVTIKVFTTPT